MRSLLKDAIWKHSLFGFAYSVFEDLILLLCSKVSLMVVKFVVHRWKNNRHIPCIIHQSVSTYWNMELIRSLAKWYDWRALFICSVTFKGDTFVSYSIVSWSQTCATWCFMVCGQRAGTNPAVSLLLLVGWGFVCLCGHMHMCVKEREIVWRSENISEVGNFDKNCT